MEEAGFDSKRRLCPDGACVGVIGPDGRCSVCARSGDSSAGVQPAGVQPAGVQDVHDIQDERAAASSDVGTSGGFDPARRLCDDGSCVGVVGADGRCGTCGRKAE